MIPNIIYFAASCKGGSFLGFPKWYKYLDGQTTTVQSNQGQVGSAACVPVINSINDVWLIVAAVIEILLRVGALIALGYVLYGSIQYVTSQGDPAKTQAARQTIFNAIGGLVISISAATVVTFVAGSFH